MDMGLRSARRTSIRISPTAQILANALGVGPGFVQRNEYVTEAWYGWQTTPWLNLKLDAQYVICSGRLYERVESQRVCAGRENDGRFLLEFSPPARKAAAEGGGRAHG